MNDMVGKPLRNRAIVVYYSPYLKRMTYGVIQDVKETFVQILGLDGVHNEGEENIYKPEDNVIQIKHDQIHLTLKERLIELSKVRIMGPK